METVKIKSGTPVNTKSLLAFIFKQMEKLNNGEIDANTACAQAKLASQASNVLNYELKRSIVQLRLKQEAGYMNDVTLREVESKPFDNTMLIG